MGLDLARGFHYYAVTGPQLSDAVAAEVRGPDVRTIKGKTLRARSPVKAPNNAPSLARILATLLALTIVAQMLASCRDT
jgi:hypothetical protein